MKEWITNIGYWLLALIIFLLEAFLWICCGVPYLLWKKLSYEVQCLRWSPPSGGMYGNMAREYKKKQARKI